MRHRCGGRAYFTDDAVVYADRWVHDKPQEIHSHSFVELATATVGQATHLAMTGT